MTLTRRRAASRAFAGIALATLVLALASPWCTPRILAFFFVDRVNVPRIARPTLPYREVSFRSGGVTLSGWLFEPVGVPRGLVVHLHARMYTRVGGIPTAEALVPHGYAVFAYDQRAHGTSGGEHCTYGQLEKEDVARAIEAIGISPVYVVGHSYGAAVALQAAADDKRIRAVVAAASYSDLRTAVEERGAALPFVTHAQVDDAIARAESIAGFHVDDVSPLAAAARIRVPVLLVAGTRDTDTPPSHSERLLAALGGPKRLFMAEGANHTNVLDEASSPAWTEIATFLDTIPQPTSRAP